LSQHIVVKDIERGGRAAPAFFTGELHRSRARSSPANNDEDPGLRPCIVLCPYNAQHLSLERSYPLYVGSL
jgi:hypothetical protein